MSAVMEETESKQTQVINYNITDAALAELEKKYETLPDAETEEGYEQIKQAIPEVRSLRMSVEEKRKELKADALEWGRKVDGEAKRITGRIIPVEEKLKAAKKAVDDRIAAEKEAKRNAEANRIKAIKEKIEQIKTVLAVPVGSNAETIGAALEQLQAIKIDESYMEFAQDAQQVLTTAITQLTSAHGQQVKYEQQQAEFEAERQRQEEERQRIAAEQEQLEAERRKAEEDRRAAEQATLEAERERARILQEEREKSERERQQRERQEAEAKAAEEAERQRKLAMSDSDKVKSYVADLMAVELPEVESEWATKVLDDCLAKLEWMQEQADTYNSNDEGGF